VKLPKVLIFTPTYSGKDYCLDEFLENCKKFTYSNKEHIIVDNTEDDGQYFEKLKAKAEPQGIKVFRVSRGNNSREALARAQNFGRKYFLEGDYDYFLSLESDIFPGYNIIDALVLHGLDIVTGLYLIGNVEQMTARPCITVLRENKQTGTMGTRLLEPEEFSEYINQGVKEVQAGGMGCCLIYRDVLENIAFTYVPGLKKHSDVYFFNDARKLGYLVCVDTTLACKHLNSDWTQVKDF
jgi:cellulose synthase/poly-beta-1,6-N-acetylglucosamine synthase-like glycosyltransferase